MFPVGFEPANPPSERPQTHSLDHVTTWIGEPVNGTQCEYDHRRRRKSDVHKVIMVPLHLIHIVMNSLSLRYQMEFVSCSAQQRFSIANIRHRLEITHNMRCEDE